MIEPYGLCFFFFQAEDGIRDLIVTGVQTCALPISPSCSGRPSWRAHGVPQSFGSIATWSFGSASVLLVIRARNHIAELIRPERQGADSHSFINAGVPAGTNVSPVHLSCAHRRSSWRHSSAR